MARRTLQWINTPVIMEAMLRYQKGILTGQMKLWIEDVLEINPKDNTSQST